MTEFRVGQNVVCVDAGDIPAFMGNCDIRGHIANASKYLEVNEVYTIASINPDLFFGELCIFLEGVDRGPRCRGLVARRFRPLQEINIGEICKRVVKRNNSVRA